MPRRKTLSPVITMACAALALTFSVAGFAAGAKAQDAPKLLPYVASVGFAAAALLVAWGVFIYLNRTAEELEPEAMQQAKREDRKVNSK